MLLAIWVMMVDAMSSTRSTGQRFRMVVIVFLLTIHRHKNTSIMLQEVASDGYTTISGPVVLYNNNNGVKDRYNIEAPTIFRSHEGINFLFFNSECYCDNSYTINYVTSTAGVLGPYSNRKVFLETGDFGLFGPGGLDIDQETGDAVFHSLKSNNTVNDGRVLSTARVKFEGRLAPIAGSSEQ